jgi:hypothetical protein
MSTSQEQRPRYYEGQYLGADDLTAAVDYARTGEARHLLGAHTWGIAAGLQLQEVTPPGGTGVDMYVRPGYAWDGFGRPIVVLAPYKISPELFQTIPYNQSRPDGMAVDVWLEYAEAETRPPGPGFAVCTPADQSSRVVETFGLVVGPRPTHASREDPISVAGRSIEALEAFRSFDPNDGPLTDESVPFQSFPAAGDPALWLIPLGQVHWKPNAVAGQPGNFVARGSDELVASRARRIYIGAVAESLLAADGILRMADRTRDYRVAPHKSDDLVRVEGALRVQGDVRLWGTQLDFRDGNGSDEGTPLMIRRTDDPATGAKMLDVQIGKATAGTTRFGVGPLNNAGAIDEKFVVLDSGNVGIGTTQPITALQIPERGLQVGISTTATDNFYFASDTAKGPRGFRLYNQNFGVGTHLVTFLPNGNVGIGTTQPVTALQIPERGIQIGISGTASDNFHFVSDVNQSRGLRLYNGNYGAGSLLLTVRADGNVGIGATAVNPSLKLDIQGDFGRTNGPATLHLWGSTVGDVGNGILFLRSGGSVVAVDKLGDRFGIGTNAPSQALEVAGDVLLLSNNNPLFLNSAHTGFPNNSVNRAEISNDTGTWRALMIVGNRSAGAGGPGLGRKVQVWDILEVQGDLTVTNVARKPGGGSWTNSSDAALKQNIQPLTQGLDKLLRLRGVSFEWKDPAGMGGLTGPQVGLVAQDVERVFPEWVSTGPNGYKELTIRGFEALAVEAFRELHAEIGRLRSRVDELEKKEQRGGQHP